MTLWRGKVWRKIRTEFTSPEFEAADRAQATRKLIAMAADAEEDQWHHPDGDFTDYDIQALPNA